MADKSGNGKPIVDSRFTIAGEGSKNFVTAPMNGEAPKTMPFLIGRDGKLYVRKDLVTSGAKGFTVTITEVK